VVIRPEIAGRIAKIHFTEGHKVAAGVPLVTLDDSIARAEVAQARASLALSKANYQRATELLQKGAGTVRARDEAVSKLRNDEATLALVQAKLEKTVINAPFRGLIGLRKVDAGDYVAIGHDIANLEDVDPMKVDFRVPESYLAAVAAGQRIDVTADAWADRTFPGEVYAIDPMIDEKGRSIVIRARISNPDGLLRPGLFVRVRLILTVTENAVLIPEEALVPVGTAQFVYVIRDGKAVKMRVEIGDRQRSDVQVLSGLGAGDMVITAGQIKLQPGTPVRVVPPGGGPPPDGKPPGGQPPGANPAGRPEG
jgi:membrane fusion protein (multidrug efflux system)